MFRLSRVTGHYLCSSHPRDLTTVSLSKTACQVHQCCFCCEWSRPSSLLSYWYLCSLTWPAIVDILKPSSIDLTLGFFMCFSVHYLFCSTRTFCSVFLLPPYIAFQSWVRGWVCWWADTSRFPTLTGRSGSEEKWKTPAETVMWESLAF